MADARNLPEVGSGHLAAASWMELAFGNDAQARDLARRVLDRNPGYDPRLRAALTLAILGFAGEAEAIADELSVANPEHTIINSVLVSDCASWHCFGTQSAGAGHGRTPIGRSL